MFLKHNDRAVYLDLSTELRDADDWVVGTLKTLEYYLDVCALAVEPLAGLLAVGTSTGIVHIFGGPGVESKLSLAEPVRTKFLQFAVSLYKLVCVDENNRLHIWDLTSYGRPKLQVTARFDLVTALAISPSHTHAFLALQSGEIRTYDMLCLRKSPYIIPNMWSLYEDKMTTSGMPTDFNTSSHTPVEFVVHPRDLNLAFVAYRGGVILSDLTQRNTLRVYEYVLIPGAPGGAGYGSHDLLAHRRPSVTAIAIHPAGHFFAAGYTDGSIAFWAVEDEDHPLAVRTIEENDVNLIDGSKLEKYLPDDTNAQMTHTPPLEREPIFKLSWSGFPHPSDPRGGETALTILGGLLADHGSGVTVLWLPPFNPPEPPANSGSGHCIHPFIRNAMRESVLPSKSFFYSTTGTTQDFFLFARDTPHFSGCFDPLSILLLVEAEGSSRAVESYQFPPPTFLVPAHPITVESPSPVSESVNSLDALSRNLASTLECLELSQEPERLKLVSPLTSGNSGVMDAQIVKLEREAYQHFDDDAGGGSTLHLKGGCAWSHEGKANDMKLGKYQPHRILITYHHDLVVQFQDISAQLLISTRSNPISHYFPHPLHSLTIDVNSVLMQPLVAMQLPQTFADQARIVSVQLATESLECLVGLQSGELFVYRLSVDSPVDKSNREAADKELTILEHLPRQRHKRFFPYIMLAPGRGPCVASAISDIGFIAASYNDGSLLVVDMRVPKIILRFDQSAKSMHRQSGIHLGRHTDTVEPMTSLTWTVCGLGSDPYLRIRLIAIYTSGATKVFTFTRSGSFYTVAAEPTSTDTSPSPIPRGSFILDAKTGSQWKADRGRLSSSLQSTTSIDGHVLWISASGKGVRCVVDVTGEKIGKAEWGHKVGTVWSVQVIERNGAHVLVAFTRNSEALVYSLPHLEHLHTLHLPGSSAQPCNSDETGDYVQVARHASGLVTQVTLGTLFNIRRAYSMPDIDYASTRLPVPPQPQPVSVGPASFLGSWLQYGQNVAFGQDKTGDQIDDLLAGPDRPIPLAEKDKPLLPSSTPTAVASGPDTQSNLYDRLSSALTERGQRLGELEDHFNSLEEGSKNMVNQAKRLAAAQTAKSTFKFW